MLNWIWLGMLGLGILTGMVNGRLEAVTQAAFAAARQGVELALGMAGVMALWLGLMKIAEEAGLVRLLARAVAPFLRLLFPRVPREHPALGAIALNLGANLLGLGNAATPLGIRAMQELAKLNPRPEEATPAMCTFLILNNSCLTLVPATVIAIRSAQGATSPTEIIGPTVFATACAALVALLADFCFRQRWRVCFLTAPRAAPPARPTSPRAGARRGSKAS